MRVIFDKYGKIVGTPTTDDYWGQGDNLTTFLEAQFLDENDQPIIFLPNQLLEVVVERPDGQISPALLMAKVNDEESHLTLGKLTIDNWITEVAGKIKFNIRLKELDFLNDVVTTKVTGICYRVIGQAIDPADQTITDTQYESLMAGLASKEDVSNKTNTMTGNENSGTKYPSTRLLYDYIKGRIILVDTVFNNMAELEAEFNNGTVGIFGDNGLYSCKVKDSNGIPNRVIVGINIVGGNYGYHAIIYNGEMIEVITGTVDESPGASTGHLILPATQKKYDLAKIGFANNGTLSGLSTTNKNTLVAAINEIFTFLGSTNPNNFSNKFDTPDSVLTCVNECREYIAEMVEGLTVVYKATYADNATNDQDGNQIKSTYAKKAADNEFTGNNIFHGQTDFEQKVTAKEAEFDDEVKIKDLTQTEGTATFNNVIVPLAVNANNPMRKGEFDAFRAGLLIGAQVVGKATNDSSGNKINEFYAHSIEIISDDQTYTYTFQLKDASGTVINQKTIDLPIESVVVSGEYDSVNQKIVLTLENGSTIDIPVGALISGLQTEITSQNKLASDLVDDTNQSNKFVSATEKAQITTNKDDIAALEARVDDYSYASMVYDAQDESIVVTGIALSYDESDEELIIVR